MLRSVLRVFFASLFFGLFFFSSKASFATTTPFRSASIVTSDGIINPAQYVNLNNCSATDGLTCDRPSAPSYGNLDFRDFGDFGIPEGSTITHVRIRVTGKANTPVLGLFTGLSRVGSPPSIFHEDCQNPSDFWRMYVLNSSTTTVYNVTTPLTNGYLATCLTLSNIRTNNFIFRVHYSFNIPWSANIDNFEIAFDYIALTPTPSPSPSPSPTPPEPFLDLPWKYQSQGKSFEDVVLDPRSWFDHKFPLQNIECCIQTVLPYSGLEKTAFYRSHNGYDYSSQNGVVLGTHVLAAAAGWATFKPEAQSAGAGNVIKIDHENGYQSWYEHLSPNGLIVSSTQGRVFVNKGQKIGEVGMTGRTTGPHIHLSVFKDSNNNGNFNDDYPWGLTDPLGWEGDSLDPWTLWESNGRKGTPSYNLFVARDPPKQEEIPTTGGSVSLGDILIDILNDTFNAEVKIIADFGPFESNGALKSIMPSVFLDAFDNLGEKVTQFLQPVTITYDYKDTDLFNTNEESLKIYWFNSGLNLWEALPSTVDTTNKKVSTQTTHFSQFALMGEVKDIVAPTTQVTLSGDMGENGWYRSGVSVTLQGADNEGGVGLLYTLYTINGSDWFEYTAPIVFPSEGTHTITYQSFDRADNKEERKTIEFNIDKTPPEAEIKFNPATLHLDFLGKDSSSSAKVDISDLPENKKSIKITDQAGNVLEIIGKDKKEKEFNSSITIESLRYNNGNLVSIDPAKLFVSYAFDKKTSVLKQLEQKFEVKGELKIKLIYSSKTGKTKVITKVKGKEKLKEELPGIRILKLNTDWGTLKYSY